MATDPIFVTLTRPLGDPICVNMGQVFTIRRMADRKEGSGQEVTILETITGGERAVVRETLAEIAQQYDLVIAAQRQAYARMMRELATRK